MKQFNKTYLPDTITYAGKVYTLNVEISAGMVANNTSLKTIAATLKQEGRNAVLVNVMSKNLKGKLDLHNKPYQPSKFIFTTSKK